jgi:hypothetical protein
MHKSIWIFSLLLTTVGLITFSDCKKDDKPPVNEGVWDIDKDGVPVFVNVNYINLSQIEKISKFRSGIGHDYSDFTEHCRSMKHYFKPFDSVRWDSVKVYVPVSGTVTRFENEGMGMKIEIESAVHPAFRFQIFHFNPVKSFSIGDVVQEGTLLGHHYGTATYSDISVIVNDPTRQGRMVSYFDVMTDAVFTKYQQRGVATRSQMIISKTLRDANPLTCMGDQFQGTDALEGWLVLK